MNLNKILAKSDGTTLLKHSTDVRDKILQIKNEYFSEKNESYSSINNWYNQLDDAALFHDIGKATEFFQKKLKTNTEDTSLDIEGDKRTLKYKHNEISFAFLTHWTNIKPEALRLIYWHHGVYHNSLENIDSEVILECVLEEELEIMKAIVKELKPDSLLENRNNRVRNIPNYYNKKNEDNEDYLFMAVLNCLKTADALASGHGDNLYSMISKKVITEYTNPFNNARFDKQVEISNTDFKTGIINGPAGFGKTTIGLLWSLKSKRKLIWVCPKNIIADGVYDSLLKEITAFNVDIGLELYYSGKSQKSNRIGSDFDCDIIITNIDNFEKPAHEGGKINKSASIYNCDVIFDEYHELTTDLPLYSLFVKILKARHNILNSRTMLLSATPADFGHLWDGANTAVYLPGKHEHYQPVHNKPFKLTLKEGFDFNKPYTGSNNELFICNAVSHSQKLLLNNRNVEYLIHSKFQKPDLTVIREAIYEHYGKNFIETSHKPFFVASLIAQSSLDISFNKVSEILLSAYSTIQRGGRCGRFYDFVGGGELVIYYCTDKANNKLAEIFGTIELRDAWWKFLNDNYKPFLTLEEFYVLFNTFNKLFSGLYKKNFSELYKKSSDSLSKIYPKLYFNTTKNKSGEMNANSNLLRSSGNEIFVTSQDEDTKEWIEPFSVRVYDISRFSDQFNENQDSSGKIIKIVKELHKVGKFKYSYVPKLKYNKSHLETIRREAKNNGNPYPLEGFNYNKRIGSYPKNLMGNNEIDSNINIEI